MNKISTKILVIALTLIPGVSFSQITTHQPVVLINSQDTICAGSVIDIPFLSTGVFVNNTYIAQLSDSNGNFTAPINVLGTLHNSQTYPGPPGYISGLIAPTMQPIPAGCNYRIRVIATNPDTIGSDYGPFCIRHCDVETNNMQDIRLCIPPGIDTCIPIHINMYNTNSTYLNGNGFQLEVHNSLDFSLINKGGLGGMVISKTDTCLHFQIPDLNFLNSLSLTAGMYYVRIVSDSSTERWNMLGTLIRLTIGAPFPSPLNLLYLDINTFNTYNIPDTTICVGTTMFYEVDPLEYNAMSDYSWTLNTNNQWPGSNDGFEAYTGIIFNGVGTDYLSVVETNYGCVGPGSDTATINVNGTPSVSISSPSQVCVGDSIQYSVPLENYTYYQWSSPNGTILDSAYNNLTIKFDTAGSGQILIHAVGLCGVADGTKNIIIKGYPAVNAGNDTLICGHDTVNLSTTAGAYSYLWSTLIDTFATTRTIAVTPDTTTTYIISSRVLGSAGCTSRDTVVVNVNPAPASNFVIYADTSQLHHYIALNNSSGKKLISYYWNWGDGTHDTIPYPTHIYADSGFYDICLSITDSNGCSNTFCDSSFHALRTTNTMVYINVAAPKPVGVAEIALLSPQIYIYPNPAANQISIYSSSFPSSQSVTISLLNVLGEMMQEEKAKWNNDISLNIKTLPEGLYFLQVKTENGSVVKRFVKE